MMKHQTQNIPMKMIQKTPKKTKLLRFPTFMPKTLPDDEIAKGINSLNSKQSKVFNAVHTLTKKNMYNIMGVMLDLCTYFFQEVEAQVNLTL